MSLSHASGPWTCPWTPSTAPSPSRRPSSRVLWLTRNAAYAVPGVLSRACPLPSLLDSTREPSSPAQVLREVAGCPPASPSGLPMAEATASRLLPLTSWYRAPRLPLALHARHLSPKRTWRHPRLPLGTPQHLLPRPATEPSRRSRGSACFMWLLRQTSHILSARSAGREPGLESIS